MTELYVCPHCGEEIDFDLRRGHQVEPTDEANRYRASLGLRWDPAISRWVEMARD